jgi:hypothetical protein
MRAIKIYEVLSFERGKDPKTAMGIGQVQILADLWKKFEKEYGQNLANLQKTDKGTFLRVNSMRGGVLKCFEKIKKIFGTKWFVWNENLTNIPHVFFKIKPEFEDIFNKAYTLVINSTNESVNFQRDSNPHKSLEIGKYAPHIVKFKDYDGEVQTIKVQNNAFKLFDMDVRIEFQEDPDIGVSGDVYVDGQKSNINLFKMVPFDYEFKSEGYGMPIAKDEEDLKRLKEEHSYWTAISGDYS